MQFGAGRRRPAASQARTAAAAAVENNDDDGESDDDEDGRFPDEWPSGSDEEQALAADAANLDRFFTVEGWERTGSASRRTATMQCRVHFHAFEEGRRPHRLLEQVLERLFSRVLHGHPPPLRIGFQLTCPSFTRPFHVPMRSPEQNRPEVIAHALASVCEQSGGGTNLFAGACDTKVLCVWSGGGDPSQQQQQQQSEVRRGGGSGAANAKG